MAASLVDFKGLQHRASAALIASLVVALSVSLAATAMGAAKPSDKAARASNEQIAKNGKNDDSVAEWDAAPDAPAAAGKPAAAPQAEAPPAVADPPAVVPPADVPPPDAPAAADVGDGSLIRVRLPLSGNADDHIKSAIQRIVGQLTRSHRGNRRPTLVLELVSQRRHAGNGEGTDFTRALSLADYLTRPEMSAVKTVAYIPRTIKGHGVLIALACEEIVMSPEAEIGEAGIDADDSRAIDPKIVSAYREVAASRRTVPEAIALGMVDRRRGILRVETEDGIEFIGRDELPALKKNHSIATQDTLVTPGSLALFTGRQGREFGFVKLLATDNESLARGLGLAPESVKQDQSLLGDWRPVMVRIEGPITRRKVSQLKTLIGSELRDRQVNWIGIAIDSAGGELEDCKDLASVLADLDPDEVQTVAYVPVEASGGAALVALACNQLVMQPEAHLGGKGTVALDRKTLETARDPLKNLASKNPSHSWSLLAAMIDPGVELFSYQNNKSGEIRYLSSEERNELQDKADWKQGVRIKAAGDPLRLTSKRAQELEIATHVVASADEFKQIYGFTNDIRTAEPNWALEFVEALSSPALAVLLLVIGFVGIYIELHAPGTGVGGFVAALAFLLFFWSNFLHGTAGWLEVLLFIGGVFCVLLEVLVIPGFGIFGLGGGAMMLVSLVLASQTFVLPRTESQLAELRHSLTIVAAAMVLVISASIALRRYLPSAPVFRTLLLAPTPEEDLVDLDYRESLVDFSHLVGQSGVASTNLMPAGKADFDGELVDVIADGLPIDRGTPIVVVKTRGNRVLVRRADV
jgi:membrane-bound serine protease (ClpP class)